MAQANSVSETIFCSAQLNNLHFYEDEKETNNKQQNEREVKEHSIYGSVMTMDDEEERSKREGGTKGDKNKSYKYAFYSIV